MNPTEPRIRVLLADDHPVVRTGIRQFLERAGDIEVVAEADDGETARVLISQYQPDVAVLDIEMPGATGIEVAGWVRASAPGVGVLLLTAFDDDPYVHAAVQAGAHGYVLKTAAPHELIRAVREVFEGRIVMDPAVVSKLVARVAGERTPPPLEPLTERELEVLALAGKGYTNKAISVQLGISDRTVQGHLGRVLQKLQAASRTEAVMRAVALGWLPSDLGRLAED